MPFSWAFVRPALLASGHKKTTELVDSPWFVLIKPTFVRLGCGKAGGAAQLSKCGFIK